MLSSSPCSASDLSFFSPSKSSNVGASSTSTVSVTSRITRRPAPTQRSSSTTSSQSFLPSSSPLSSLRSSPLSSPPSDSSRKRKYIKQESISAPPAALPREVKRLRYTLNKEKTPKRKAGPSVKKSSRASSRQSPPAPSPEAIYRSSRSRSTSHFHATDLEDIPCKRRYVTDETGAPGDRHLSSETVLLGLVKSYKAYFRNLDDPNDKSFEPHPTHCPVVELEYPNSHASEKFILLAPKDKDHYNPIMDLERSLYTMVEFYVPKHLQHLFGTIPRATLNDDVTPPASPSPSPPCSQSSSTSTSSLSSLTLSESSALTSLSSSCSSSTIDRLPVLRAVQRAIHLQDGPLFLRAMNRVNCLLRSLKYPEIPEDPFAPAPPNMLMTTVHSWTNKALEEKVLMRIIEENYQRTVGPNVPSLKRYEAFTSTVYGELMPSLVKQIIIDTKLSEDSLFLDLGSGVGNIVVQASLQSGCKSYGIELMPHPARVARDMAEQIKIRCRMWGLTMGEVELEEGDMLESRRLDELISKADVVLVDNKVFEESLNEALRPKFLDLKEGACLVSLQPFVKHINTRFTKRNVDDMSAIFAVEEKTYHPGDVSWGNSGGSYYIHKVDRAGYANVKERVESLHGTSGRSSRSRK